MSIIPDNIFMEQTSIYTTQERGDQPVGLKVRDIALERVRRIEPGHELKEKRTLAWHFELKEKSIKSKVRGRDRCP